MTSYLYRSGDSCPNPDDIYNSQTGGCEEPNQCADTQGVTIFHMYHRSTRANAYDPFPAEGNERPLTVCSDECRYSASGYSGDDTCGGLRDDPLNQYCITPYLGQGGPCSDGDSDHQTQTPNPSPPDGDPDPNPADPPEPPDPDDPTDPAVTCNKTPGYVWSGSVCTPIFEDDSPDPDPNQPPPGTPGGSGGSGGNGGGDTGGGDGGDGGDGGGDPGTGSGGSGTGSGGGDSQSENPNNVLGTECHQTLQCTGDAYQCALLHQQKEARCQIQESLDFEEQKPSIEALFDSEDYTMGDSEEIDIPSFIGEGARFLPASCPAPISMALSGKTLYLDTQPFCTFAIDLSFLIVAFATLASALYIGRAFGGE